MNEDIDNYETVDLDRRGMMVRLAVVASLLAAAPVLMTSTSALAKHKKKDKKGKRDKKGKKGKKDKKDKTSTPPPDDSGICTQIFC